ncbi:hypothetical protein [Natrialba asiatica]|uniref:hypothetical protein n=1 Tax=Natrialba asiatica TaxID=64602 RepID=UPI00126941CF|nr:hypothetical protein [Natrialba asiatica]
MPDYQLKTQTISLYDLLRRCADEAIDLQREDGSFPSAQNGVYGQLETPVGTTSHWLDLFLFVYKQTHDRRFRQVADRAATYLASDEARPQGYTFYFRKAGANRCNGIVGQAKPIESLYLAGQRLDRPMLANIATEVFTLHPFDDRLGLWEAIEVDGTNLSFDRTLNHQIIFAASTSELASLSKVAENRINGFLDHLAETIDIHDDGLVCHYIRPPLKNIIRTIPQLSSHAHLVRNEIASHYYERSEKRRTKEIGYHVTVLSALAKLKENFPKHSVWDQRKIQKAFSFIETEDYQRKVQANTPKYGSVLPGIHHACILSTFFDSTETEISNSIEVEISRSYDPETGLFTGEGTDPMFQSSLINFATMLPDVDIEVPFREL